MDHYKAKTHREEENFKHERREIGGLIHQTMVISGGPILARNSNNSRKNYSKYLLPNKLINQYMMNVRAKKKPWLASILILFTNEDETGVTYPHNAAMVITLKIGSTSINIVLIDTESLADIIFKETLDSLNIEGLKMESTDTVLYGFVESYTLTLGSVQLPLT